MTAVEVEREIVALRAEVEQLRARVADPTVRVTSEPLTYERHGPHSYFQDLWNAERDPDQRSRQARWARLTRHAAEMETVNRERAARAELELRHAGIEYRVTPNRTEGQGGWFAPPAWLVDTFATAPRTGRVLAALMPWFPLPPNVQSINVPFLNPGMSGGAFADGSPIPEGDPVDGLDTSAVVPISGTVEPSVQLLEQSPPGAHLDWAWFQDLSEQYDQALEQQLLYGNGNVSGSGPGNSQLIGVTSRSTINTILWTSATPTDVAFYNQLGIVAAKVGNNRKRPPEAWLMRTARWAWLGSSPDASSRPFVLPTGVSGRALVADPTGARVSDDLLGWPAYVNDAIPNTLTGGGVQPAGGSQDEVIALRPSDLMLLEGAPRTDVFFDVVSGTAEVRLRFMRYVAAITGRRTTGIVALVGTGMTLPASYST